VEHRHCRSRSHLLSRRQQNLCLRHSGWSTHANANGHTASNTYTVSYRDSNVDTACYSNSDGDTAGNTYADSYRDSNVNATCYSNTNSYAYTDSKSLAKY
jgi:hypothetical protein